MTYTWFLLFAVTAVMLLPVGQTKPKTQALNIIIKDLDSKSSSSSSSSEDSESSSDESKSSGDVAKSSSEKSSSSSGLKTSQGKKNEENKSPGSSSVASRSFAFAPEDSFTSNGIPRQPYYYNPSLLERLIGVNRLVKTLLGGHGRTDDHILSRSSTGDDASYFLTRKGQMNSLTSEGDILRSLPVWVLLSQLGGGFTNDNVVQNLLNLRNFGKVSNAIPFVGRDVEGILRNIPFVNSLLSMRSNFEGSFPDNSGERDAGANVLSLLKVLGRVLKMEGMTRNLPTAEDIPRRRPTGESITNTLPASEGSSRRLSNAEYSQSMPSKADDIQSIPSKRDMPPKVTTAGTILRRLTNARGTVSRSPNSENIPLSSSIEEGVTRNSAGNEGLLNTYTNEGRLLRKLYNTGGYRPFGSEDRAHVYSTADNRQRIPSHEDRLPRRVPENRSYGISSDLDSSSPSLNRQQTM